MVTWTGGESHLASLDNRGILPVTFLYCALRNVMGVGNRSETKKGNTTRQPARLVSWGMFPAFSCVCSPHSFLNFNG